MFAFSISAPATLRSAFGKWLALAALAAASLSATGQTVSLAHDTHPYAFRSADSVARGPGVVASHDVQIEGAHWLRLQFEGVRLPNGVQLRITSLLDGAQQHLSAKTLAQWQNTSAYFNGSAVRVELLAGRVGDAGRFGIAKVIAGKANEQPETQCGPTDDRTSSNAKDRARLLDIGCTANLTTKGCFITAGHCLATASALDVVEFNVPKSNADRSLNHPAPKDQYVPNTSTRQFSNNGIGNDWGVFTVFANSETGLTPLQAQGSKLKLAKELPVVGGAVEITGYGIDDGVDNQSQQVSTGPITAVNTGATSLDYRADTEGGNSGSAVLSGGRVVAIHTHGGCSVNGGANHGTLFTNKGFKTAYKAICSTAE